MTEVAGLPMPTPETDDLGRYLEDTITIDWQTPAVMQRAKALLGDCREPEDRIRVLFEFVRDEIDHSLDVKTHTATCRASEVLSEGTGLCYAKSHLLAAFLRYAGFPTGFCYARLASETEASRFTLHCFNAVYWSPVATSASMTPTRTRPATPAAAPAPAPAPSPGWIFLDARGNRGELESECRFEAPWSLAYVPHSERGEAFVPFIYKRPSKRIIDLLDRAPDFAAVVRNLPDAV